MTILGKVLAALLVQHTAAGYSKFSVEPAPESCANGACSDARYSSFYGTWVRQESRETARERLAIVGRALADSVDAALCLVEDEHGSVRRLPAEECKPSPGAYRRGGMPAFRRLDLATLALAVLIVESGAREDVQVGRGRAKKPDDVGGEGRGPAGELCLMQIHPTNIPRFVGSDAKPEDVLGLDEGSLRRCFDAGVQMLLRARAYCSQHLELGPNAWQHATVSLYATGTSCVGAGKGVLEKVRVRVALYLKLRPMVERGLAASKSP